MTPRQKQDAAFVPGIGYCYLNLSRRLGVAYGDVLNFVDWMDAVDNTEPRTWTIPTVWQQQSIVTLTNDQKIAIQEERYMEHERRRRLLAKQH